MSTLYWCPHQVLKATGAPEHHRKQALRACCPNAMYILCNQGTRSHLFAMSAVAQALLDHGYTVTTVFYDKSNIVHENYNEILIEDR